MRECVGERACEENARGRRSHSHYRPCSDMNLATRNIISKNVVRLSKLLYRCHDRCTIWGI